MKIIIGILLGLLLVVGVWAGLIYFTDILDAPTTPANPAVQLVGKKWYLQGMDYAAANIYVEFQAENKIVGFAGCNNFFGTYELEGITISFNDIGSTKVFCEQTAETETKFLAGLESVDSFSLENNKLTLKGGEEELVFEQNTELR